MQVGWLKDMAHRPALAEDQPANYSARGSSQKTPPVPRVIVLLLKRTPCLKKTAREGRLTSTQNESLNGRVLVIFIAITMSMLRIGVWVASQVVLFQVYGRERVSREHLQIVKIKPRLVVSNGDVLWSRGFEHFLIVGAIWMTLTVLLFSLAWKLLPKPYHDAMQQGTYAGWSILTLIFLFFALGLLPLKMTLIIAVVTLVVVLSTARASLPIDGQT